MPGGFVTQNQSLESPRIEYSAAGEANDQTDLFFHSSAVNDADFDVLREGQQVTYTLGKGPKGPRAENVELSDG
ncbi:MAG: cold shock domain-containing protein [Planctomycetota bacterium]|nr:cold shock domain-containing protein [Planctomycetota bacterium]